MARSTAAVLSLVVRFVRFERVSFGAVEPGLSVEAVDCADAVLRDGATVAGGLVTFEAATDFAVEVFSAAPSGFVFATAVDDFAVVDFAADDLVVVDFAVDDFLPEVLLLNQPTIPVGAGFDPFAAGCSALAFPAQMTPIISATRHLRSIRAPSMESADRPVFRIGGRFQ